MFLHILSIRYIIFILFSIHYVFTSENITYPTINSVLNYLQNITGYLTKNTIPSCISVNIYSISNTAGLLISPKYKKNFILPEKAWCIAEDIFYKEDDPLTYKKIYYEDENYIKMIKWSENCIPETTTITKQYTLKELFAIRTVHSLTRGTLKLYIEKRKKYLQNNEPTQLNVSISTNGGTICNEALPNEILSKMVIYLDYKTAFSILPCVSKKFEQYIKLFDISFNIKDSIQEDTFSYTRLVSSMFAQPFSTNVFYDPRFSHQEFEQQWNISLEECLWNYSFIIKKTEKDTYLVRSKNRTDKQFLEILQACSLNEEYTPIKINEIKAKRCISLIQNFLNNKTFFYDRSLHKAYLKIEKLFIEELKDIVFFIAIWNEISLSLSDQKDKKLKDFYNRPSLLIILIKLLYENLNTKKITLKDIPHTFLDYARTIKKLHLTESSRNLDPNINILKDILKKNREYSCYILLENRQTLSPLQNDSFHKIFSKKTTIVVSLQTIVFVFIALYFIHFSKILHNPILTYNSTYWPVKKLGLI